MVSKIVRAADVYKFGSGIGDLLSSILQQNAALAISSPAITAMTDSSTGAVSGTNPPSIPNMALPVAFTHVTGNDLAPKAGFDTAMAASYDAAKAYAEWLNTVRARLDMAPITYTGTPSVSGTIAAQTKALTGVDGSGTNAVDATTGIAQLTNARKNARILMRASNEVLNAVGGTPISRYEPSNEGLAMTANAATAAGVAGASNSQSLSDTDVDAFLVKLADAYATMHAKVAEAITAATRAKPRYVYVGKQN